jgi:hypothetical protein
LNAEKLSLHHLILGETGGTLCVHGIVALLAWSLVLDEAQAKRTATILVAAELVNGGLRIVCRVEADYTSAAGATVWLVLNLSLLNLADSGEQLDKILVASGPWQL